MNNPYAEHVTQQRVIALFRDELGYSYLGDWQHREDNASVEESLLLPFLVEQGYSPAHAKAAVDVLRQETLLAGRSLYAANEAVYSLLRYGIPVQVEAGENHQTLFCINWKQPEKNHFAIAEEVTLREGLERRPDLVLYINGIAVAVIELKKASVSVNQGIGQLISNQGPEYNPGFFTTVQWLMAGNNSEGLRYGAIGTPAKHYQRWKEDEGDASLSLLDKYLCKICNKERFIELLHDFVVFDGGRKKLPRPHQYFAVKYAQEHVRAYRGGIIWHSQGSGKSLVMVMLARWILENMPKARVLVVTDRIELDQQIEGVFHNAGQKHVQRIDRGRDLLPALQRHDLRLMCALIHKFGTRSQRGEQDLKAYIAALASQPGLAVGELFVFVDECHRTQSGNLYKAMRATMPAAVFIGFTGTPLLKTDKQTTMELFGGYIHTYKFDEAVRDKVVLDLLYEARDIDQRLSSEAKIDALFESRTAPLNEWQKAELKKRWGTMQNLLSSCSRMEKIVGEICFDFETKPVLSGGRGNAILVAASIRDACKYYELFQQTPLRGKCGLVTSYNLQTRDAAEDMGENTETARQFIYKTYVALLEHVKARAGKTPAEVYEERTKKLFVKEPANMRLVIVVDKLLTGFDAVPCSYLYIDKHMQDHGLFQAICRTNRVAGDEEDWKDFGRIVDFKDLFRKVEHSIAVYTSELDMPPDAANPQILLKNRLAACREKLDAAVEAFQLACEPVPPPKGDLEYIHYFCGNTELPDDLAAHEPRRTGLYHSVIKLLRAYANMADEMLAAGYTPDEAAHIKGLVSQAVHLRDAVRMASGEVLDFKPFEADMRDLLDRYVEASEPRIISAFDDMSLLEIVEQSGIQEAIEKRFAKLRHNQEAVAEAIENNVRRVIHDEQASNPEFYERMSTVLAELIALRRAKALEYEAYLQRLAEEVLHPMQQGHGGAIPKSCDTKGKRALYDNLGKDEALALRVHDALLKECPHGWRRNHAKRNAVKALLARQLPPHENVERIFKIVDAQGEY